jgi:hypothetical protein
VAPLLGVVTAVLTLLGFMVFGSNTPDTKDGGARIVHFYVQHSTQQQVAAYVIALAGVALLLFGASLRQRLTAAGSPWASVATSGLAVAAAGMMVAGGIHFALANETKHLTAAGAAALNSVDGSALFAVFGGLAVTEAAAAFACWPARTLPRAFLVVGLVFAVISISPVGFIGGLLSLLWIGAVGIYLALRPAPAAAVPESEALAWA